MKYISLDIETTGLNPKTDNILSFGAIIEDTLVQKSFKDVPKFYSVIDIDNITGGSIYALNMNKDLIHTINDLQTSYSEPKTLLTKLKLMERKYGSFRFSKIDTLMLEFYNWLSIYDLAQDRLNLAGKNLSEFDLGFLKELEDFSMIKYKSRILDPAIYFSKTTDESLPSLPECKKRAGLSKEVHHNALYDAWDVIRLIRIGMKN